MLLTDATMTMVLSDVDIQIYLENKSININPLPDISVALGSCSLDLRLGNRFRVFEYSKVAFIDPNNVNSQDVTKEIVINNGNPFILHPGDFVLATTLEKITIPDDLVGRLEGRSSLGRLGIVVHSTASVVDPGFSGVIVMELGNMGRVPVALYPGMRVCAITFEKLTTASKVPYGKKKSAKYANQSAPVESKINLD